MGWQDELALSAEPDAASRARRYVTSALRGEPVELVDDARLAVTELVTNAQLHGVPPIWVRAGRIGDRVRLEVEDHGRQLLVLPARSSDAMTGRGLSLVSALSSGWGISPSSTPGAKVVWVELGAPGRPPSSADGPELGLDALLAWPQEASDEPEHAVRLGSVPTDLLLEAKRHIDNVVRELTLARAGGTAEASAPAFAALVETVTRSFAGARGAIKRQALAAAARGDDETELVLRLPASAAAAGERYLAALDEVDRYSRGARLLTLATPPVHRVFRSWYVQALVDQLHALARGEPVPVPTTFVRVLSAEVTALSALRDTADRLALLQKVNSELTGSRTAQECAEVVVRNACESLGALSARTYVVDGDQLRSLHVHGDDPERVARDERLPIDADLPGPVVFRSGTPLSLRSLAHITERFPALTHVFATERSLHVAPLVVGDHRLGVISMTLPTGGELDEQTQTRFVTALADALAQAVERAQALEAARLANQRLRLLAEASEALTATLHLPQTLEVLLRQLVPRWADWVSVTLLQDGLATHAEVLHSDPARTPAARELAERWPLHQAAVTGAADVLRTGTSQLRSELPEPALDDAADPGQVELLRSLGLRSALSVALPGRAGDLGVLTLVTGDSGRRYTEEDVAHAEDLARRAALALETARVLARLQDAVGADPGDDLALLVAEHHDLA
jgi:GAF domain-containing protein/anti-sigma regulatory factor (Ser/Thr protein kinase)